MYFCEAGIIFDFSEHVEQLDYAVTVPSVNGQETAHFFVEHPVYGTTGYPTYEDACEDMHGIFGFGQYVETCEAMVNAGYDGDHFWFDAQNMLTKIRCDYWFWTWTPETGIVYDPEPEPDTFSKPSRQKRRNDKKTSRRKGSTKRFRDRSRKCAHEGHVWNVYSRGLSGDYAKRGKRLKKTGRPQKVNVHFTNGIPQDTFNLTETDVHEYYSVTTWDGYKSIEDFFQYMDSMDWEKIPSEVRFSVEWYAENPFTAEYPEPEYFEMNATLRKTQKTLSAEKAKKEYLNFKKKYQVYKKYAKKLRAFYEEMHAELDV